jgi:hypothetical protein
MYKNRLTFLLVIDWHTMSDLQQVNQRREREMKFLSESDTEQIRRLDELRKMKRKEEKTRRPKEIRMPLPKPLFERQFTDCGDLRYLERHPEVPESLRDILTQDRRMTVDDLSIDDRRMTIDELMTEREYLIHRVREYVATITRERSDSHADTDLLARKRFPR